MTGSMVQYLRHTQLSTFPIIILLMFTVNLKTSQPPGRQKDGSLFEKVENWSGVVLESFENTVNFIRLLGQINLH